MKRAILAASALALSLAAGSAFAAAETATAPIKSIDLKSHELTLDGGKVFKLPASWHLHAFKPGQRVTVSYQDHMGSMTVTRIRHSA